MLPFVLSLAASRISHLVLTSDNFDRVTTGQIPTIVRFYTCHRQPSLALDEQYDLLAEMFEAIDGINVAGINCGKFRHFCYAHGVAQTPVIKLYTQDAVHLYDGGMSHESVSRWATGITGVHGRDLQQALRKPNGRVFKEMLNETHCVFTMFFNPSNSVAKRFLPPMQEVAEAFKYDDRVAFAANDIDLYKFFNWDYDLSLAQPDLRLYCKDEPEPIKFTGRRTSEDLIDFINDYCGTQRGLNGRLNSEAGLIDEVSQIVEDFLTKGKKPHYISDMEQVEGTKYYVWVMNEVLQKGDAFILQERNRLNELLESGTLSPEKLDEFQIRVNILGVFASYLDDKE
jgi:protein disulfide-isomerase A6